MLQHGLTLNTILSKKGKGHSQKILCYMLPFIQNIQSRQIYGNRKKILGFLKAREQGTEKTLLMGINFPLG